MATIRLESAPIGLESAPIGLESSGVRSRCDRWSPRQKDSCRNDHCRIYRAGKGIAPHIAGLVANPGDTNFVRGTKTEKKNRGIESNQTCELLVLTITDGTPNDFIFMAFIAEC